MKKTIFTSLIFTFLLLAVPACAASQTVSVKVAEFPVTLNVVQVGKGYYDWLTEDKGLPGHYAQYPLLVYKDIT